ncbi:MAG: NHLP leader peptide family RiPP precursor [Candidatus Muirbacterium halophilum]|nr:NHLP leader peptide family RiPP precursor [Candidatus Muirbacterium halophilum]MCK9476147.1 NHLP leader peptide family RiPP precursor [Candidatus Muirbacterium halophilum]
MNWTEQEVKATIEKIQAKASTDKKFREKVLSNPEQAIKEISGKDIPEDFKIKIVENAKGIDQTYVLPDFIGEELTDEDLDNVAGGMGRKCGSQCQGYGRCHCQGQAN